MFLPRLAALALLMPAPALACSFAGPGEAFTDEGAGDVTAPTAPGALASLDITRGVGPVCDEDGICQSSSCDDLGWMSWRFPAAVDDRSDDIPASSEVTQTQVAYQLRFIDGTLPDDFGLPDGPYAAFLNGDQASLFFVWIDDDVDEQEAFDFTVGVTAVDAAGNASDEVIFTISDPGRTAPVDEDDEDDEGSGCSALPLTASGWALAVLAVVRRRSRRP